MTMFLPPNEAQLEHIKKEDVYRSAAELEEDVTQLIAWLAMQPHLPNVTGMSDVCKKVNAKGCGG